MKHLATGLMLIVGSATPAFGQWTIDAAVGVVAPTSGSGFRSGLDLMGAVEQRLDPGLPLALRLEVGWNRTITRTDLDGIVDPPLAGTRLRPDVLAGFGLYQVRELRSNHTNFGLNFGGGLRYPIGPVQPFFEVRYHRRLRARGGYQVHSVPVRRAPSISVIRPGGGECLTARAPFCSLMPMGIRAETIRARVPAAENPYHALLEAAAARAQRYLADIGERFVGVEAPALQQMRILGGPLPGHGEDPHAVLQLLDESGSPATVAVMGGRFFGGVIGGSLPVTVAAHWLADAWDQNACLFEMSPVSAYLEEVVLAWMLELFGLPADCGGALVTGTQMADVTALAAARHRVLRRHGWDVERDGLFGAPGVTVIVGEEVHATMLKALSLLGFGKGRVLTVPADAQGRMDPTAIPRVSGPVILCAQLGNVNSGGCDPLVEICRVARTMDAWVHVDGAFGMWAAVAPQRKQLVAGLELADSWATDGHKWVNTPQDCGMVFVRDREALREAMAISGAYYGTTARRDPMRWCPDSSRRARAVEVWAALRTLGRDGLAAQIERTCQHAERFATGLREAGYEILNDVVLNQVLVAFASDAATERVIEGVQADGTCWCGGTVWKGRKAMRISVSSWATTDDDVRRSLDAMCRIAARVGR